MDGSITSTAIYSIGAEFGSLTKVTWIALAYTLADVGLAIVFTSLANIIGRFNAYLVAQGIFFAFSLGSGFAQTLDQLIACRCLQGIGGSGLYTIALVIWQETSSGRYRQAVGGSIGLCIGAGGVMGPVLGGIITGNTTWRWIFCKSQCRSALRLHADLQRRDQPTDHGHLYGTIHLDFPSWCR